MKKRTLLRVALAVVAILLAASWGLSLALHGGWARRSLLARLSASFGRPVDAAYFEFSLWNGPRLEAHSVTVSEDPRFGAEYFLRADELTASPRWSDLLRGRLEFGTLSLTRASLNLVRDAGGHWNIESWLPPPKAPGVTASAAAASNEIPRGSADPGAVARVPLRLAHIQIDSGRINFKRGVEKLPFALVGVSGRLDQDGAGRWSIDLQAHPARASVALQEAGTLRLRGVVAGTSARLRPASLALSWEEASFADVIRLFRGSDHGVRGTLAAEFSASVDDSAVAPPDWKIAGVVRMTDMHRWDLAPRAADPAVNVKVMAAWRPAEERLQLLDCIVEAPRSHLRAAGDFRWLRGFSPRVRISDSQVGFEDLLDWRRAFLPGVADGLAAEGAVALDGSLAGWPLHIEDMTLDSPGATVREGPASAPIRLGRIQIAWGGAAVPAALRGLLALKPVEVRLPGAVAVARSRSAPAPTPPPAGVLRVAGTLGPFDPSDSLGHWPYQLTISGETTRAQDLLRLAGLGRPPNAQWSVEGPAVMQMAWSGQLGHGKPTLSGTLKLRGLQINTVLMSAPVMISSATIDLRPGVAHVKIDAAQALGADWKGSLTRQDPQPAWTFDLSADRLDVSVLEQWLGSREQSFLERVLPFAGPSGATPARDEALAHLAAQGKLQVAEVAIGPLRVEGFDAQAQLDGRDVLLLGAQGDFYGGRVRGDLEARLGAVPSYAFRGQVTRTNVAELTAVAPPMAGRLAGIASGELKLGARGMAAKDLIDSLEGEGSLRLRDVVLRGPSVTGGDDAFADSQGRNQDYSGAVTAKLHVTAGRVRVDHLLFVGRDASFVATGSVDFARHLDLLIQSSLTTGDTAEAESVGARDSWSVGGTLDAPLVSRSTHLARDPAAVPSARR